MTPRHEGGALASGAHHKVQRAQFIAMSREEEITRFVAFCIEQYKHRRGGDGESVYDLFAQTGVLRFLVDFFDVEHCLDGDQIIDDVEKIIARRQKGGVA